MGRTYGIVSTTAGSTDPHNLLGTIKMGSELKDLNAGVYRGSIIGDAAYEGNPGFLGDEQGAMEKLSDTRAELFAGEPALAQ